MTRYGIKQLQKYFDSLPDDTTSITVDYSLLSRIYWFKNIHVALKNDEQIIFDLTRFTKLASFKYDLHEISYKAFRSMSLCFITFTWQIITGNDYMPIFQFNVNAPLTYVNMPHIEWTPEIGTQFINIMPSIEELYVKDIKYYNIPHNTCVKQPNLTYLTLYNPSKQPDTYNKLFKTYNGRITMIAPGMYSIKKA